MLKNIYEVAKSSYTEVSNIVPQPRATDLKNDK